MNKQIKLNDFLNFKSISQLKASPNQKHLGFVVGTLNEKENQNEYVIYVSDGKNHRQMTSLKKESNFVWEDDNHLLFATKRFKSEEEATDSTFIYRIAIDGGEANLAYTLNIPVNQFWVLNDNKLLLTSPTDLKHPNFYSYSDSKREKLKKTKKENEDFHELTQIPFWSNGTQIIEGLRTRLFIYDIKDDVLEPLTTPNLDVSSVELSKDKKRFVYTANTFKTKAPFKNRLFETNLETMETTPLITTNKYAIHGLIPLNDSLYIFASDQKKLGINQNPDLFKVVGVNELEVIKENIDLGNRIGSDVRLGANSPVVYDEDSFIYTGTADGKSQLFEVKDNQVELIYDKGGSIDGFIKVNDELILMGLFNMKLQELVDTNLNPLSNFNDKHHQKNIIHPQKFEFESSGDMVSGWVLVPTDYETQEEVKAILDIHGGPKTEYGEVYYHEMQVWANMGYLVMFCNPHGSSGKGDSFSDIRGKYGTIDYDDIMNFVDLVLDKYPKINPDKVGVTGGSYGGFMTNWIIGHTNRFACAVTQRSISNWTSFYGVSDIGYRFVEDQAGVGIYAPKDQAEMWNQSPLKYASNFSTPTLVIHSTDDYRCPIDQGYQLFTALVDRQVEAKMLVVKNENHDLSRGGRPKARLKRLREMTDWFKRFLQ